MRAFAVGQYVELYPTLPSASGGSIESGTRAIVDEVDGDRCLIALLTSETRTGERVWVSAADLFPA